jgi:large subunit ribosomal protein L21
MYAVIQSGGKQYRVEPGEVLEVELLAEPGEPAADSDADSASDRKGAVRFERVLLVGGGGGEGKERFTVGSPAVAGAVVTATLVGETRGPKIRVFKTKRRNTQRRTRGHRQHLHRVRIEEIQLPSGYANAEEGA